MTDHPPSSTSLGEDRSEPDSSAPIGGDDSWPTVPVRLRGWARGRWDRYREDPGALAESTVSFLAVALGTALVLATLHPSRLWQTTTPTGGDMGSHVWGPRYLLDHLLPNFRLTGWTPDWYNGFPAYQFYMVVPSLMVVALHVGLPWWAAIPVVLAAAGATYLAWARPRLYPYRLFVAIGAGIVFLLAVGVPYTRSFKLITALGLLFVPLACWALAKLADLPFPIPPLVSGAGLIFIYNREPLFNNTGNIIGGNFQSTMAGEFAFSISLTLAILYLGVATKGLRTGRHRGLAAGLFALAGLCHLIPAFFVLACTAALFLIHPDKARFKWLATMVPVAGLTTAFWVLPFWWRRDFVNDMGWEKLPAPGANRGLEAIKLAGDQESVFYYLFPQGLRWLMAAAAVGVIVSWVRRYSVGMVLSLAWAGTMLGFTVLPQYRLWNARLLPFLYLSVALLAAIGVGELIRLAGSAASGRADRPLRPVAVTAAAVSVFGILLYVSLPLTGVVNQIERKPVTVASGTTTETKTESSFLVFNTTAVNPVAGWADWNYKGLELKEAQPAGCAAEGSTTPCTSGGWPEYRNLVATMAELGQDPDHGCGRSFWEYAKNPLEGYGTPMALMMFPYWTDGCIGSQEGLYFESSTTVPYHFLMQSELSAEPSRAQRNLDYPTFDLDAGVRHLQLLGVKYYLAVSAQAVSAADLHPDLTAVATSGPWHVYQVADAPLVEPLAYEPVIATGMGEAQLDWLPESQAWFLGDQLDVPLAVDGPKEWERVQVETVPDDTLRLVQWARNQLGETGPTSPVPDLPRRELAKVEVSGVAQDREGISFDVDRVGVPVLVKASYFPNWDVEGAEGPFRVSPNLMVVVPTSEHVSLSYTRTPVDVFAILLTVLGLVGIVWLARAKPVDIPPLRQSRASAWLDDLVSLDLSARGAAASAGPGDPPEGWMPPPDWVPPAGWSPPEGWAPPTPGASAVVIGDDDPRSPALTEDHGSTTSTTTEPAVEVAPDDAVPFDVAPRDDRPGSD